MLLSLFAPSPTAPLPAWASPASPLRPGCYRAEGPHTLHTLALAHGDDGLITACDSFTGRVLGDPLVHARELGAGTRVDLRASRLAPHGRLWGSVLVGVTGWQWLVEPEVSPRGRLVQHLAGRYRQCRAGDRRGGRAERGRCTGQLHHATG